jgi:adenine deaminase
VKLNTADIDLSLSLSQNKVKVMQLIPNNITTNQVIREVTVRNGKYVNNVEDDILKIAVIERHHYTGNVGIGLIEGYGLKNGAVAMTIAHDSHNIIVVGDNDEDMLLAVNDLKNMQGGLTIVSNGEVLDHLALEIAGLMTNQSIDFVQQKLLDLEKKAHKLGVNDAVDDAFLSLAFMALPVIPDLKLTDQGLFDVRTFEHVSIEGDRE